MNKPTMSVIKNDEVKVGGKLRLSSAMTRIMVTARNLLYRGKYSRKKSVSGMKFLPHDSIMDRTVAARSHHFSLPLTTIKPRTKRKITIAPM